MVINQKFKELIPPLTADERKQLEENILKDGIRDPLVVWNGTLVDGHNRYEIAQKHGLEYRVVEKEFMDEDEACRWIILNQFGRRNITTYDRGRLALRLKPLVAENAQKKMLSGKANPDKKSYQGYDGKDVFSKTNSKDQENKHQNTIKEKNKKDRENKTNYIVAKSAGISEDTLAKVEKIEHKATPEQKAALRRGEKSINNVFQEIKRQEKATAQESKREENYEKVEKLESPLDAQGLFQTVVIDPPWDWGDEGDVNQFGRAKPEYHTMPISDIESLPVNKIADDNCHLYLWVTNRSLPKAFRLIEAWGFRYITCLTWVKPSIGMGNYFRGSTEQVLFAVKGSQMLKRRDVGTHFEAKRGDGHSAKPDEFYSLVESCSYGPYIDVFGRKERDGWTVWGENS